MTWQEIVTVIAKEAKRVGVADSERISIGYFRRPDENSPIGMYNLPEFRALISVAMKDITSPEFAPDADGGQE